MKMPATTRVAISIAAFAALTVAFQAAARDAGERSDPGWRSAAVVAPVGSAGRNAPARAPTAAEPVMQVASGTELTESANPIRRR